MKRRNFLLGGAMFAMVPQVASATCWPGDPGSTVCKPPPKINYNGTKSVKPTLRPTACVTPQAKRLMTGPGVEFWFTYYQRYRKGSTEDMEPVIRADCITKQWVVPGTRLGFWVDCHDPKDKKLYRWWWETKPITDNGKYHMKLVRKVRLKG